MNQDHDMAIVVYDAIAEVWNVVVFGEAPPHQINSHSDAILPDPGADRLVFWDDSDNQFEFLTAGLGLVIAVNTMNVRQSDINHNNIAGVSSTLHKIGEIVEFVEIVAPGVGPVNTARLYVDNSGGKTRLMVQFGTGVAQQIAIEP